MVKAPAPRTIAHLGNMSILGLGNRFGPDPAAYGAERLGGQFGFCDPQADISVGFVRSELAFMEVLQATLGRELYRCAEALGRREPRAARARDATGGQSARRVRPPDARRTGGGDLLSVASDHDRRE